MPEFGTVEIPYPAAGTVPDVPADLLLMAQRIAALLDPVATVAALPASGEYTGQTKTVQSTPGALWSWSGVAWVMYGEAFFADAGARTTAIPAPVAGMRSRLADGTRWVYTSAWVSLVPHAEWTATSASNASAGTNSVGTLVDVVGKTNDTAFATNSTNVITIVADGIYAMDFWGSLPVSPTGVTYIQAVVSGMTPSAVFKANGSTVSGAWGGALFAGTFLAAGTTITLSYFHTSAGAQVLTSGYALSRIG